MTTPSISATTPTNTAIAAAVPTATPAKVAAVGGQHLPPAAAAAAATPFVATVDPVPLQKSLQELQKQIDGELGALNRELFNLKIRELYFQNNYPLNEESKEDPATIVGKRLRLAQGRQDLNQLKFRVTILAMAMKA